MCDKFGRLRCVGAKSLGHESETPGIEEMMQGLAEDEDVFVVVDRRYF